MTNRHTLEEQLSDLLERAAPQPPKTLDGAAIRAASPRDPTVSPVTTGTAQRREVPRWAASIAAAVVVLAVAVTVAVISVHRTNGHHTNASQQPGGAKAVNVARRAATVAALDRLLSSFAVPSIWRPSTRSLSRDLSLPTDSASDYLVSRARLWTTTEAVDAAMSYLASHRPREVGLGNTSAPTPGFASAVFTPAGRWEPSTDYAGMDISVVIERLPTGPVGVEIEASAYWLPVRTPADTIPNSVSGATVAIRTAPSGTVYRGRLPAAKARTLAGKINQLPVTYQPASTCPMPGPSATLTFATPTEPQKVTVSSYCPSGVFVQPSTGGMKLDLALGRSFHTLLSMLGLPAAFGQR